MSINFKDRQAAKPNRYKITDENGESKYVTLERADEPTVVGTPLNAQVLNAAFSSTAADIAAVAAVAASKAPGGLVHASDGVSRTLDQISSLVISTIKEMDTHTIRILGVNLKFDDGLPGTLTIQKENSVGGGLYCTAILATWWGNILVGQADEDSCFWKWLNPPMELGQEYTTLERWRNNPVLCKAIEVTVPSGGGTVKFPGIQNNFVIRMEVFDKYGPIPPYGSSSDAESRWYTFDATTADLKVSIGSSATVENCRAIAYYTGSILV